MPEVADAFRRFGSSYQEAHGAAMLPSHRRAIADIIACRTEALGGQQWCCNHCGTLLHVFHSCRNRACPKCHAEQTQAWLEQRRAEMLPVPYFHVTVTVPEELRAALRRHQIDGYGALMNAAAGAAAAGRGAARAATAARVGTRGAADQNHEPNAQPVSHAGCVLHTAGQRRTPVCTAGYRSRRVIAPDHPWRNRRLFHRSFALADQDQLVAHQAHDGRGHLAERTRIHDQIEM